MKHFILYAVFFVGGASFFALADQLNFITFLNSDRADNVEFHLGQRGYINPLIDCVPSAKSPPKKAALQERVENAVQLLKDQKLVTDVSVFFRDLNNGPTFGLNEKTLFVGASLLKVPILIYYLKTQELDSQMQYKKLRFIESGFKSSHYNLNQNIGARETLVDGQDYSIEKLLELMIVHSDNRATYLLLENNQQVDIVSTLNDMGVPLYFDGTETLVSVRDYASIFRILYNATYLSRNASSYALDLMTKSQLQTGLVAGSKNVVVSHKYGERELPNKVRQFHDCGIVYLPQRPYLLCIMTRGKDFKELNQAVADIAKAVYDYMSDKKISL